MSGQKSRKQGSGLPFEGAKLEPERDHDQRDQSDAASHTALAEPILGLGFFDQPGSGLDGLFSGRRNAQEAVAVKGVDMRAGLFEAVSQFVELIVDGIHVQAFHREPLRHDAKSAPGLIQVGEGGVKESGGGAAFGMILGKLLMALGAKGAWAGRQHGIRCFGNAMVAVTLGALGPLVLFEGLFVFAAVKKAGVAGVTNAATLADAGQTDGHGGVVSVATIAGGGAQIVVLEKGAAMDAGAVLGQLIRRHGGTIRQLESSHGDWAGVAGATRFGNALA